MLIAIIPYKGHRDGKSRLARRLSLLEREKLNRDMLRHVLNRLRAASGINDVLVVTPETDIPAETLADRGQGLNRAVAQGIEAALQRGAARVLVIPADLPHISAEDISALLAADDDFISGVIAPSKDGGTGALLLKRGCMIEPRFGPESALAHANALELSGRPARVLLRSGLALDVDLPEDLDLIGDNLVDIAWSRNAADLGGAVHGAEQSGKDLAWPDFEE